MQGPHPPDPGLRPSNLLGERVWGNHETSHHKLHIVRLDVLFPAPIHNFDDMVGLFFFYEHNICSDSVFHFSYDPLARSEKDDKFERLDPRMEVRTSNDFFESSMVLVERGTSFSGLNSFLFVTRVTPFPGRSVIELLVTTNGKHFDVVRVPDGMELLDFELVGESLGSVFLFVNAGGFDSRQGSLLISDDTGAEFRLSLERVHRLVNGTADFYWVDGFNACLVNIVSGVNGALGTLISFDNGDHWEPVRAPNARRDRSPIKCGADDCAINFSVSNSSTLSTLFSSFRAVGVMIGTGSIGPSGQASARDELSTWVSFNGGGYWSHVVEGSSTYAVGFAGGILVVAAAGRATNRVEFSVDQGWTWHTFEFREDPLFVNGLYLGYGNSLVNVVISGSDANSTRQASFFIDFESLNLRTCSEDTLENDNIPDEKWARGNVPNGQLKEEFEDRMMNDNFFFFFFF